MHHFCDCYFRSDLHVYELDVVQGPISDGLVHLFILSDPVLKVLQCLQQLTTKQKSRRGGASQLEQYYADSDASPRPTWYCLLSQTHHKQPKYSSHELRVAATNHSLPICVHILQTLMTGNSHAEEVCHTTVMHHQRAWFCLLHHTTLHHDNSQICVTQVATANCNIPHLCSHPCSLGCTSFCSGSSARGLEGHCRLTRCTGTATWYENGFSAGHQ